MQQDKIFKTVHQYNKKPLLHTDLCKLQEIAKDYSSVKNYVYQRYGGVSGLSKLYPGYTVQNEMTESGFRTQIGLPSVYFYRAVFEAMGDIKTQWTKTKGSILAAVNSNERFTPQEKHYLRFVIKVSSCFDNILNGKKVNIPEEMKESYRCIVAELEQTESSTEALNRYLCRQVRRKTCKLHTDKSDGFALAERAYRYGTQGNEHGIFISTKENRRRIFIPLTDENEYTRQLYIRLKPEECGIEIAVPIERKIRIHRDFINEVGLSLGMWYMITTDAGNVYGGSFGELHHEFVEYVRSSEKVYQREKENNAGRKKYKSHKAKLDARLETYVNQEINRMIVEERPRVVYMPKYPQGSVKGHDKKINYSVNMWRKGFVRERIKQKCRENSIEVVEVIGKAISTECNRCGAQGEYRKEIFLCENCGYQEDKKINAAKNAIKRGRIERQDQVLVH